VQGVEIRDFTEPDLAEAVAFLARQVHRADLPGAAPPSEPKLRWFTFQNPARQAGIPLGWLLRGAGGDIVGIMLCVPQWFRYRDRAFLLLMSGSYYVDDRFRGLGLALFQRYRALNKRNALYCTTANEMSSAVWKRFGGYPLTATDHEILGVLRFGPLAEEVAYRRASNALIARAAGGVLGAVPGMAASRWRRLRAGAVLTKLDRGPGLAGMQDDGSAEHADRITAVRSEPFLQWRYFDGPDATRALFRFEGGEGGRCHVAVNLQRRGYRGQIRALTVLDVWGAMPGDSIVSLAACLAQEYRDRADVVVFRGQPPERQRALCAAGLRRRALPVPIGWCIDREGLLPRAPWYVVPADGDMAV
jgi:hypothetical protein